MLSAGLHVLLISAQCQQLRGISWDSHVLRWLMRLRILFNIFVALFLDDVRQCEYIFSPNYLDCERWPDMITSISVIVTSSGSHFSALVSPAELKLIFSVVLFCRLMLVKYLPVYASLRSCGLLVRTCVEWSATWTRYKGVACERRVNIEVAAALSICWLSCNINFILRGSNKDVRWRMCFVLAAVRRVSRLRLNFADGRSFKGC